MNNLIIILLSFFSFNLVGQEVTNTDFDGHKWEAPYNLPIPKDWTVERFLIPINFAPQILYRGVEDIRFTPGWGNVNSDQYWTYAFLWYLEDSPKMDAKIIAGNLKDYYTGLIEVNLKSPKGPVEKALPVLTSFTETRTDKDDLNTYTGTIEMLDYMQQRPITLNCIAHVKSCTEGNRTILFFELSPKSFKHNNWLILNQLWIEFKCKNK